MIKSRAQLRHAKAVQDISEFALTGLSVRLQAKCYGSWLLNCLLHRYLRKIMEYIDIKVKGAIPLLYWKRYIFATWEIFIETGQHSSY